MKNLAEYISKRRKGLEYLTWRNCNLLQLPQPLPMSLTLSSLRHENRELLGQGSKLLSQIYLLHYTTIVDNLCTWDWSHLKNSRFRVPISLHRAHLLFGFLCELRVSEPNEPLRFRFTRKIFVCVCVLKALHEIGFDVLLTTLIGFSRWLQLHSRFSFQRPIHLFSYIFVIG